MIRIVFWHDRDKLMRLNLHKILVNLGIDAQGLVTRACTTRSFSLSEEEIEWLPQAYGLGTITKCPFLFEIELPVVDTSNPPSDALRKNAASLKAELGDCLERLGASSFDRDLPLLRLNIDGGHEYV